MANKESEKEFTFTWKIENFSMFHHKNEQSLESHAFTAECLGGSQWCLKHYPRGNNVEHKGNVSCFLYAKEFSTIEKVPVDYTIDIVNPNGETFMSCKSAHKRLFTETKNWGFGELIRQDKLNEEIRKCSDILTLCCCIRSKAIDEQVTKCEARTKIDFNRCSFNWNIKFSNVSKWSESKIFSFAEVSAIEINLTAPGQDVLIKIRKVKVQKLEVLKCQISLLSIEGVERDSKTTSHLFNSDDDVWEFPSFITKEKLNDKLNPVLRNGTFTLKFEFSISNGIETKEDIVYKYENITVNSSEVRDNLATLSNDFRSMFLSQKYTDVKLRVESELVPVHKNVLSARSPVFCDMFDQYVAESKTSIVDIGGDLDGETLKLFLNFIYSGSADNMSYESARKLMIAAYKYQVPSLKGACSKFLMSALSTKNVCDVLVIAEKVGHHPLKISALDYIKSNSSKI